ncbi:gliding motility-associated C-terminal domain-containing protein [Pontibacter vulgaris]|uniref:Ig-like domain-containing protein n=1 Tax=Pontibacter vulgaris TaxID=2905679 RepID=UPI001FA78415|nr:gliding motility-associated C-terminal domain-containing protein [Pontibacter vulgaris]
MQPILKGLFKLLPLYFAILFASATYAQTCTPIITSLGDKSLCEDGEITLIASEAAQYTWSTGETSRSIKVKSGGEYWVKTVDASGCTGTSDIMRIAAKPDASIADPVDFFTYCSYSGGEATFDLTVENTSTTKETNANYSIKWGDGSVSKYGKDFKTVSHRYTSAGSFTLELTVTSESGCTSTKTERVFVGSNPGLGLASRGNTSDCAPSTFIFDILNTEGNSIQTIYKFWFDDGTDTLTYTHANLPKTIEHTFTESSKGKPYNSFTLNGYAVNPCGTTPASVGGIKISKGPTAGLTVSATEGCIGQTFNLKDISEGGFNANQSSNTYNREWIISPATGWEFVSGTIRSATPTIKINEPGEYKIKIYVTPSGGNLKCSGDSAVSIIKVSAPPKAGFTLAPTPEQGCAPNLVKAVNTSVGDNIEYAWSVAPTTGWSYATGSTARSASPNFNFTTPGNYTVTLTATNGCAPSSTVSQAITIKGKPVVTLPSPQTYCGPKIIAFSNANSLHKPTYNAKLGTITGYEWKVTGPAAVTYENGTSSGSQYPSINFTQAGTYDVAVVAINECGQSSAPAVQRVTINPLPILEIAAAKPAICVGDNVELTASGADTYTWAPATGLSTTTGSKVTAYPTETTTYTITGVNKTTGCTSTTTYKVVVNTPPTVQATSSTPEICVGQGSAILTATGADTYTWAPAAGLSATTGKSVTATPDKTTTYTVTGFNSETGCNSTTTVTVKVNPLPEVNAGADLVICDKLVATKLQASPAGGTWSGTNVTTDGYFTPSGKGDFILTYTYTNENGCTNSDDVKITVSEVLVANAGTDKEACQNSGAFILQGAPFGGKWSGSEHVSEDGTFTPSTAGTFTLTYTYYTGSCFTTDEMIVVVKPLPTAPSVTGIQDICYNTGTSLMAETTAGVNGTFSWYTQEKGGQPIATTAAGTAFETGALTKSTDYYIEFASSESGCASTRTKVTVVVRPEIAKPIVQPYVMCRPGKAILAAEGTASNYNWYDESGKLVFTGKVFEPEFTTTGTHTYFAEGFVENCAGPRAEVTVTVYPELDNNRLNAVAEICSGQTPDPLNGSEPTGGNSRYTYRWEYSLDGKVYTSIGGAFTATYQPGALTKSTWFRRVVLSAGCELTSAPVLVSVTPVISKNELYTVPVICAGNQPAKLTGKLPEGGNKIYTYRWEYSTNNITYTSIENSNNAEYQPGVLLVPTWFRRVVTSGTCSEDISAPVKVTVVPAVSNNIIRGTQTICAGEAAAQLTGELPAGGNGTGSYTYYWEASVGGSGFSEIPNSRGTSKQNWNPGQVKETTAFRRVVLSGTCEVSISEPVTVTVNPQLVNIIAGSQTICVGDAISPIPGEPASGGDGTNYTYAWESSTDGKPFTAITGAPNLPGFTPENPSVTTKYRRKVTSGACTSYSNIVEITVNQLPDAPVASAAPVCEGSSAVLTVNGASGTTYRWYDRNGTLLHSGPETTYTTTHALAAGNETYFVEAVNSNKCVGSRSKLEVIVYKPLVNNTISTKTPLVCADVTVINFSASEPTGSNGNYKYSWEISTDNGKSFRVVAITKEYTHKAALTGPTIFRRVVTAAPCGTLTSNEVAVNIVPVISNNNILSGAQNLCFGENASLIEASKPDGGGENLTYRWEMSTDAGNAKTYKTAEGNYSAQNYQPGKLDKTAWFRRVVISELCGENPSTPVAVNITPQILNNQLKPLSSDQVICAGSEAAEIKGTSPSGGNGVYSFQWWQSIDGGATFAKATGTSTAANYNPGILTKTTLYKRVVTSGNCASESDVITVTVNKGILNNMLYAAAEICKGASPALLTGTTPTGGEEGKYEYLWEYSATGNTGSFTPAPGNNSRTDGSYQPEALQNNTWFRRKVSSGGCSVYSAPIKVTVNTPLGNYNIKDSQSIYAGTIPATLTGLYTTPVTGGNDKYEYRWEMSTDEGQNKTFVAAPGAYTSKDYVFQSGLRKTTWFRRVIASGGCEVISNEIVISVIAEIADNVIKSDQVICVGNTPAQLQGTVPTGGEGQFSYRWESSTTSEATGFVTAQGQGNNAQNFQPNAVSKPTWFRRVVTSGPHTAISNTILISVRPALDNNKISTNQTICSGTTPATLTGSAPTGGSGTYTYLWEMSTAGPTSGFMTAPGNNNGQNYSPAALSQAAWFRRVVTSEACDKLVSNVVAVSINSLPKAPAAADAIVCSGGIVTLTATSMGDGRLEWYDAATGGSLLATGRSFTTTPLQHTTTYYVQEVSLSCAGARKAVTVTVTQPSADAGLDITIVKGQSATLNASGGDRYTWAPAPGISDLNIPNPVVKPEVTTTYKVTVETAGGCTFTDEVTVTVLQQVLIPNTFTPNRDGINDTWEIPNIGSYPNCKVQVFNQWGNKVFSSDGYKQPWDGRFNGQELPLATYYYIIYLDKNEKPLSGSVTIVK